MAMPLIQPRRLIVWHEDSRRANPDATNRIKLIHDNSSQDGTKEKTKTLRYSGHAHELTFSCYHRFHYLNDPICCALFVDELSHAREHFLFRLWAYILMPNHVHLFIYPTQNEYKIAAILQSIKGKTSKRYRDILLPESPEKYDKLCIKTATKKVFRFWQAGGGFDRNLWNAKAIHSSINYIE